MKQIRNEKRNTKKTEKKTDEVKGEGRRVERTSEQREGDERVTKKDQADKIVERERCE